LMILSGVPGSGKTLVGLRLAHAQRCNDQYRCAYMSGNGPLLKVLKASLARAYSKEEKCTLAEAKRYSEAMLHSIHSFIEEGRRSDRPPIENVVIFDEAQRAWNQPKMEKMDARRRKYNETIRTDHPDDQVFSEPKTLLNIMSRREGGAVIVALCGNGQEIHDGESGIEEWVRASSEVDGWTITCSPHVDFSSLDSSIVERVSVDPDLHLDIPLRSHRAEGHSNWANAVLSGNSSLAKNLIRNDVFPIYLTRSVETARLHLQQGSLGSRRYGLLASSSAARLRRDGVEVSADFRKGIDYAKWFTGPRDDFRSSFSLETAATEFEVQGLELDWSVLVWSWDLLLSEDACCFQSLRGSKWVALKDGRKQQFLKNKYRVLLTRAREGMIIVVPTGSLTDPTRRSVEMDQLEEYFVRCGLIPLPSDTVTLGKEGSSLPEG